MPNYVPPESPEDKLFVLDETIKFSAAEQEALGLLPSKAETRIGILACVGIYRPLVDALLATLGRRAREVSESASAKATLEETVRDYTEVLKRRTRRQKHNVEVLVNHGLPESGDVPALDSWSDLKQTAEKLLAGDALSSTAYGPTANPSAAEVQAALTAAQGEHEDVAAADSAVQAAQMPSMPRTSRSISRSAKSATTPSTSPAAKTPPASAACCGS